MRAVFLDRDGVINKNMQTSVRSIEDFDLIPRSPQAIRLFNQAHIKVIVLTNQSIVGRGIISQSDLDTIHAHMNQSLKKEGAFIDDLFYCGDAEESPRRKPAPGMLLEALEMYQLFPSETPFVGDALRDLQAAEAAQCQPVLVRTGHGEKTLKEGLPPSLLTVPVFEDLWHFSQSWLFS